MSCVACQPDFPVKRPTDDYVGERERERKRKRKREREREREKKREKKRASRLKNKKSKQWKAQNPGID